MAKDPAVSVYDVGPTIQTEADGMAVARVSTFVAAAMRQLLSGILTMVDDELAGWCWRTAPR